MYESRHSPLHDGFATPDAPAALLGVDSAAQNMALARRIERATGTVLKMENIDEIKSGRKFARGMIPSFDEHFTFSIHSLVSAGARGC